MSPFPRVVLSAESAQVIRVFRFVTGSYVALVQLSVWAVALTSNANVGPVLFWLLPISAVTSVASAWLNPDRAGWIVSLLAAWAPYVALLTVPQTAAEPWLPFGLLSTAVAVSSAMVPRPRLAVAMLAVFTVVQGWLLYNPPGFARIAASVIHGIPILLTYQVAVSLGVLLSYRAAREYFKEVEARREYLAQLAEAESMLERQRADRLRATQRLHETVLNTLRAVGRHSDGQAAEIAERCADDLVVLDDWEFESRPHAISEVVDTSISGVDLGSLDVQVNSDRDLTLNAETAEAIRSMLTELLVNVTRHARATQVVVGWKVLDDMRLVFTVEDNGIGIPDKASGRLGIRRIVTDTAAAFDGQVLLSDRPGGGTVVTLRIRLRAPGVGQPTGRFTLNLPRTILKTIAAATLAWGVIISPLVVIDLEQPVLVGTTSVIASLGLLLALTLRDRLSDAVTLTAMLLAALNLVLAERFSDSCASASPLQWLMNVFVIVCMVGAVFGSTWIRVVAVLLGLSTPLYVLLTMEQGCMEYVWLPWISMFAVIPPTVAFAITNATPEREVIDATRLDKVLTEQLRRERQADERRLRWASALERSRRVMDEIVYSGAIDDGVRQRAEVADAQLRGQLLIEPVEDGALASFALTLIDAAAGRGVALKAEVLNVSRRMDELPVVARERVADVLALAQGEAQLRLFVVGDEESMTLIVPIVPGSMPTFGDGMAAEGFVEMQIEDTRLEFDPQPVDAAGFLPLWISLSRPISA